MKFVSVVVACLGVSSGPVAFNAHAAQMSQEQQAQDTLSSDPRVVTGELPCGLKYFVMKHDNPPKRAAVWMHIDTGSLNETEKQRGIAHYLEHMAFNGSKNFPPGTVVKYFESLGLQFGRDQNASTSFDQTNYQLFLPDNSMEKLRQALLFMSDVNGRLTLDPKEIETERQIILEEKTARKSGRQRIQDYMNSRLAPGSLFAVRSPIGTEESILSVQREDFLDYYTKYYTPSNTAIIIVADIDPALVVPEIAAALADAGEKKPKPVPADAALTPPTAPYAVVAADPELTRATVGFTRVRMPQGPVTTVSGLRERYVGQLAMAAFNRRLQEAAKRGEVSYQGGLAYDSDLVSTLRTTQVQASGDPAKWKTMLFDIAGMLQQAREYSFSQNEIELARKDLLASAEQQAQQESSLPARAFVMRINQAVASGEPVRSAAQRLESAKQLLPGVSEQECSEWFKREFEPTNVMIFIQVPSDISGIPTEPQLLEIGLEALSKPTAQAGRESEISKLMEKLPTPGSVTEQSKHEPTGVWSAWLSNGVRVHHKYSDYHKNEVFVRISLFGGEVLETPANRGVTSLAMQAWNDQSVAAFTSTQVNAYMADKKVTVRGGGGGDTLGLTISGTPDEIEVGFQLAHLLLTQPKLQSVSVNRWKEQTLQSIKAAELNPNSRFASLIASTLYPKDEVRTKPLTREMVEQRTLEEAQSWLDVQVSQSPIEVAVVGDISHERTVELVRTYVASLPTRPRVHNGLMADQRKIPREKGPKTADISMKTHTPTANVLVGFHGPDSLDVEATRTMNMAARIMTSRLTQSVREKERLVYSISAVSVAGSTYPGYGLFRISAPTQPEKPDALAALIETMLAEFAAKGPTEDELSIAKGQIANTLDEQMKEPTFWLGALDSVTYDGRTLEDILTAPAFMNTLTTSQVREVFAKYYKPENSVKVILRPILEEAQAEAPAPAADPVQGQEPK